MKLLTLASALTLVGSLAGNTWAGDCPHPYKPPKQHRPHRPKPPVTPPVPTVVPVTPPCHCEGERGEQGPPGENGTVTVIRHNTETIRYEFGLTPRVGVMGFIQAPHGDWGWGPALQLEFRLDEKNYVDLDAAVALLADQSAWSPGRESGYMVHGGLVHQLDRHLGLTAGVYIASIDGSTSNGGYSGNYLGIDAGAVLREKVGPLDLRFELTPIIGGLRDTHEPGTQLAVGIAGSAFVGVKL